MKRTVALILAALAALVVVAGLVHLVLVATNLAEPAATTVYGLTTRRFWATTAAGLALVGVAVGGLAWMRPGSRLATIVALAAGLIAIFGGALNLAVANGGPGTGNGVVGAAGALVLGLIAVVIAGLGMTRSRTPI